MLGHVDLIIAINSCKKEIGKLTYSIRYGNYGAQYIATLRESLQRKERELELLQELASLYYEDL